MANVKKQAKNTKSVQQTDPNAEFNAKWDALPLWDKIKGPFIVALLFTLTGIILLLFSNALGYFMFYPAIMFFLATIAAYFGIRPSKNSKPPRPDIMHDPMYRHLRETYFINPTLSITALQATIIRAQHIRICPAIFIIALQATIIVLQATIIRAQHIRICPAISIIILGTTSRLLLNNPSSKESIFLCVMLM